jgi:transposase
MRKLTLRNFHRSGPVTTKLYQVHHRVERPQTPPMARRSHPSHHLERPDFPASQRAIVEIDEKAADRLVEPQARRSAGSSAVGNPFFDAKDLVQVRYEMVRRHQVDRLAISEAATAFGVTRPTFYKAQNALRAAGLAGLLPGRRGPKGGHKVSAEVVAFVIQLKAANPELTTSQCLDAIAARFGVKVHRRSLERALARKKKRIQRA